MAGARSSEFLYTKSSLNEEGPFNGVIIHLKPGDIEFLDKNNLPHQELRVRSPNNNQVFAARQCLAMIHHLDSEVTPFDLSESGFQYAKKIAQLINDRQSDKLEYIPEVGIFIRR